MSPSVLLSSAWCGVVAGALLVALGAPHAVAQDVSAAAPPASFDCERAPGVDEHIICADPILRRADFALATQYRALMDTLAGTARAEALRADQRTWIATRNRECGVSKFTKIGATEMPGYVDCFLDAYGEREADLRQIAASPDQAPEAISAPIRKSLYGIDPITPPGVLSITRDTGLKPPADVREPYFWPNDATLLVLAAGNDGLALQAVDAEGRVTVRAPNVAPSGWTGRVCGTADRVVLAPAERGAALRMIDGAAAREVTRAQIPTNAATACGERLDLERDRREVIDPTGRVALDLGPRDGPPSDGEADRYASLGTSMGKAPTIAPPIRLDRRYALRARYAAFAHAFVISPAALPSTLRPALQRRWAKTNCLPYWVVDAETGASTTRCIPYGGYLQSLPLPLETAAGSFFVAADASGGGARADWAGLYGIEQGAPVLRLAGPVGHPSLSPNGCRLAVLGRVDKARDATVLTLDLCALAKPGG